MPRRARLRPRVRSRARAPLSPPSCCVPGCPAVPGRRLHPLPHSLGLRQRWLQAIVGRRPEPERRKCSLQLQRLRHPLICSAHFRPGEPVTAQTLPSIFAETPLEPPEEMVEEPTASGSEPGGAEGEGARGRIGDLVLAAELMEMVNETVQHVQKEAHFEEAFGHDHGAYVLPDDPAILTKMVKEMQETVHAQSWRLSVLQHELASTLALYKELKERYEKERSTLSLELTSQVSELRMQNASLRCEREELQRKLRRVQEQADSASSTVLFLSHQMKEREGKVKEAAFSVENMRPRSKWLRFYTGFESYERFADFLRFVTQDAALCSGRIRGDISRSRAEGLAPTTLSHADQLLLVMSRLRLGLLLQDLAYRFKISETTVSRVWLNWTEVIQARLMQIPVVCSPKYVDAFEPKRTIQHRGAPLIVLECTDLFFEGQTKERCRLRTSQPYRGHYVRRGYTLVSASGYMTFATSLAFGIRARGNKRGQLEEEEEEEERGEEEGEGQSGPQLPSFLLGGCPTDEQRALSREVLSVRSHVDKVLNYRFLKCVYPRSMEAQVDRAWTICSYLVCLLHDPMGLR